MLTRQTLQYVRKQNIKPKIEHRESEEILTKKRKKYKSILVKRNNFASTDTPKAMLKIIQILTKNNNSTLFRN